LIDADTDATNDLYVADIENGQLSDLSQASAGEATPSHPNPGEGANVKGVVKVSQDASHAAFVATGVLTEEENVEGEAAQEGAYNMYVAEAGGKVKFVDRLCSGPSISGSTSDANCPRSLEFGENGIGEKNDNGMWLPEAGEAPAHFTPDGRYLLFTSYAHLTPDDTDGVSDAYRYDFQTGELIRISFGRNGNDGNGNDNRFPVLIGHGGNEGSSTPIELVEGAGRAISSDGSVVIFSTAAPLVSHDTNTGNQPGCEEHLTGCDVYEWEQQGHGTCSEAGGCINLVSDGVSPQGSIIGLGGVISASGRDITFGTRRGLAPADTDGVGDAYDARVNGGFPPPVAPTPCGGAEQCHPPTQPEGTPPLTGSETFGGSGNSRETLECAKGRHKERKHGQVRCVANRHKRHRHKRKHRAKHGRRPRSNGGGGK
jgi:hypothetical protein